ncbi:MAG: Fe-S cluster assembly protein SufB [Elusimicrobia bacterium RIFCSPLOWO2_01_FULL_64_13]|nr:MAG: Fe-S cluster assembly protein SufB [Elusimicrobia bacterium RIFCSPHIGHO2_01_FULL_64_10]OGR97817.1 MAG: Fe-S cluster assembly protein SufB [Elusimicrobia bacterium RIFCSPLOWO2_01_FULL_64_13]
MKSATPERLEPLKTDDYKFGFSDPEHYVFKSRKGLDREIVAEISWMKKEPEWMRDFRLKAFDIFNSKPMPNWGDTELMGQIDFQNMYYYLKPTEKIEADWSNVPDDIKRTFDKIGIPEAEQKFLAGVTAQYDSEAVYHSLRKELEAQGIVFMDMDSGLREHPDVVKKYFSTVIPPEDNKFAALNSAVWSGGSFVYIPKGVKVATPLQAYFRINSKNTGQFERTLIIADEGSSVHYIEGCTAPTYSSDSLHSAVVELIALPGSHLRYTTIQNWSNNVFNLVTKRAMAHRDSIVEWLDGNLGSKLTMKFPAVYLVGEGARGEILSCAMAGKGQHQDAGAKLVFAAPNTSGTIISKSVSKNGGRSSYRGLVKVYPNAANVKVNVRCDALLLDEESRSDTYPTMEINEESATVSHEATVSKVGEEQLFYLMSRGLKESDAVALIVNGFFEAFVKELPMEYAVELNRLIGMEMEGSVG